MNENEAMNDNDLFDDDELMKKVTKPPEFPPATREQVEETWQSIAAHIEAGQVVAAEPQASGEAIAEVAPRRRLSGWLESLFPSAPAWSLQLARVAALLVVGFLGAWLAANQGWLPGTGTPQAVSVPDEGPVGDPDRNWMAVDDYGERLEALLLGLARGDAQGEIGSVVREVSREMLGDNRFYRRVAERNQDASLSELLSRVEIILLVLATAPEGEEEQVIQNLREFIGESDLIDELREVRSSVPRMTRPRITTTGSM
jgi:hypothetical protein